MKTLKLQVILSFIAIMLLGHTAVDAMPIMLEGMTREKAAVKIVDELGYQGVAKAYDRQVQPFSDVVSSKGAIYLVQQLGIMRGVGEGKFDPTSMITAEQGRIINERIQQAIGKVLPWKHGFYAIASNNQMERIKDLNAVSFGWSQVEYDNRTNQFTLNSSSQNNNDFKVPQGFHIPIDFAKQHNVETYLMVYFEDKDGSAMKLFTNPEMSEKIIEDIVALCNGLTRDGVTRAFDGITIDFENFKDPALQEPFNQFLITLEKKLSTYNKKLNVAVQPTKYFKGYDYQTIGKVADHVILMAHDYATKKLTPFEMEIGSVYTPLTPIGEVYKDLAIILDPLVGIQDKNKVVLQISFASTQWQTKDGKVIHEYPYTPSYDKINERLKQPDVVTRYDSVVGNTYATYSQDGITNTIWYEDEKSVQLKENLVKLLGIGGVSYWRLGTIPSFVK